MIVVHHKVPAACRLLGAWVVFVAFIGCANDSASDRRFAPSDFPQGEAAAPEETRPDIAALQDRLVAYEAEMVALGIARDAPLVVTRRGALGGGVDKEAQPEAESDDMSVNSLESAVMEVDADPAAEKSKCTSICAVAEAVCMLERRICELAVEHSAEDNYQGLCTRAGEDCERATTACDVCGDPEVP
jgi:hypothetical protein